MKRFIKFLLAMAAFFASLCAFVCVLERLSSRLNLTADAEEDPKVEKIQFDLDTKNRLPRESVFSISNTAARFRYQISLSVRCRLPG